MAVPTAHIQVVLEEQRVPKSLETALRRVGAAASFWSLSDTLRLGLSTSADAVVVVAPSGTPDSHDRLRSLFDRMADHPRATLVLQSEAHPRPRASHPPTLPVSFGAALDADELAVRLSTMIEMRDSLESLHCGHGVDRSPEPTVAQAYLRQMRLASQIQRELLPDVLPNYGPISFSAIYRPAEHVSGDIYDIQALDEEHVAIGLADVTGHGVPAALLTVFLKRALRGREGRDGGHLLRPDQVLERLNDEILDVSFSECTFAAVVYAVLNTRTLQLQLARAGAPYPVLRRADGSLSLLRPAGMLIGVLPEATFAVENVQLRPGDSLLLYSDGLDRLVFPPRRLRSPGETPAAMTGFRPRDNGNGGGKVLRRQAGPLPAGGNDDSGLWEQAGAAAAVASEPADLPQGTEGRPRTQPRSGNGDGNDNGASAGPSVHLLRHSTQAAHSAAGDTSVPPDQIITQSAWYALLREQGEQAALEHISFRHDLLRRIGHPLDDLTVLAMQVES